MMAMIIMMAMMTLMMAMSTKMMTMMEMTKMTMMEMTESSSLSSCWANLFHHFCNKGPQGWPHLRLILGEFAPVPPLRLPRFGLSADPVPRVPGPQRRKELRASSEQGKWAAKVQREEAAWLPLHLNGFGACALGAKRLMRPALSSVQEQRLEEALPL